VLNHAKSNNTIESDEEAKLRARLKKSETNQGRLESECHLPLPCFLDFAVA
jgi:hypothetical protein